MPLRNTVESLLDQSVKSVASKMDYWIQQVDQQETSWSSLLPSTLLEGIMNTLVENKCFTKQAFKRLVTPQIRFLDVSHIENSAEMAHCLRIASVKCPLLTNLVCSRSTEDKSKRIPNILQTVYITFLPKFEQLEVLILAHSHQIGDECLCILGSFAKNLGKLDVSKCPKITDMGIKGLCVSVDEAGNEDEKVGQCKSIYYLIINETSVTKKGVKMALKNLPTLGFLECDHSLTEILVDLYQEASSQQKRMISFPYLTLLNNTAEKFEDLMYRKGDLGLAVSLCPFLAQIIIQTQKGLTDDDLLALSECTMLQNLEILNGSVCEITFAGGVMPLLEAIGSSLLMLTLEGLEDVNIGAIIEFCPALNQLRLTENISYSSSVERWTHRPNPKRRRTENVILEKLKKLYITENYGEEFPGVPNSRGVLPREWLLLLLTSPLLEVLCAVCCESLTDDILRQAIHFHHGLTQLKSLDIDSCPNVTKRGIDLFLDETNPLSLNQIYLTIGGGNSREETSSLITLEDIEEWRQKIANENWKVDIFVTEPQYTALPYF